MRVFERSQFLGIPVHQAWEFISNPRNLARITPASLDFRIMTQVPDQIHEGLVIEYRVRPVLGIAVKWLSVINNIHRPFSFTDEQLKGPYRYWKHTHILKEVPGGVMMEDKILYAPPLDGIFPWIDRAIVVPQLNEIFDHRKKTLQELFVRT